MAYNSLSSICFSFLFIRALVDTISIHMIDEFYAIGWFSLLFLAFFLLKAMLLYVCFFPFLLFSWYIGQKDIHLFASDAYTM
jgi:hypothetical protein